MMSALAGSYTESWLVGDISGRSTFCSCATATCCPITTCVTTCSPPRGGPSCSFTGAAALASATGMMSTASPARGTTAKPAAPGARVAGAGAGCAGGSAEGAPGTSGACAETECAASASAPARIRAAIAGVFIMGVGRNSAARDQSAHIVVEGLGAALALHVDEHALSGAELLVETHHVVHVGERLAVDVADHVARAQAELLVQASRLDLAHQEPSIRVWHDQGLVEEFRPAELLLQLPSVDELPIGADRLNDRRRRDGGGSLSVLHEHCFAHAVTDNHDAIAFHRVQPHAGRNLFARTESRLGLSLNDDERTAAGRARGDASQRHVQIAGCDARYGRRAPRGGTPEKLHAAERTQIGEIGAPGARHRGRGRLEHAPSPLRQRPAQQEQGRDRRQSGYRAVREHGLDPPGRANKALRDRK